MTRKKYISVNEAARIKGCSRQAIHNAIQTNRLEAVAETVEKVEWKVSVVSLARLVINPNMRRVGRLPANGNKGSK